MHQSGDEADDALRDPVGNGNQVRLAERWQVREAVEAPAEWLDLPAVS
jgi:hypothetical protein